nr:hypothetical protein Iba_scaffold1676554CG0010 [Ipomoea batatas]
MDSGGGAQRSSSRDELVDGQQASSDNLEAPAVDRGMKPSEASMAFERNAAAVKLRISISDELEASLPMIYG